MSTYTPTLGLERITPGDQSGLWGNTTNNNLTLIDQAVSGVTPISFAALSGSVRTLTDFNGAADEARSAVLNITGIATGSNTVVVPNKQKTYLVRNNTGQDVVFRTATPTATYAVEAGNSILVFCDGNNNVFTGIQAPGSGTLSVSGGGTGATTFTAGFVKSTGGTNALTSAAGIALGSEVSGVLGVPNGGTGGSSFAPGSLIVGNTTGTFGTLVGGGAGQVATWNGSTWTAATPTTGSGTVTSVSGTGTASGLTLSGTVTTSGSITLSGAVNSLAAGTYAINISGTAASATTAGGLSSTLAVASGGTGATSFSAAGLLTTSTGAQLTGATFTGSIIQSSTFSVTAAGTSQGAATGITTDNVYVTSASASSAPFNGVRLPAITANRKITIYNTAANIINVYPPSGGFIDNQNSNTPVQLEGGKQITFVGFGAIWLSNYGSGLSTGGMYSYGKGGTDGASSQIRITSFDGTNTGGKSIRVSTFADANGTLEVINKNYDTSILSLNNVGNFFVAGSASKPGGGTWADSSDSRLKDNQQPLTGALDKITSLNPVSYSWKYNTTSPTVGFIAQEVQQVMPNAVSENNPTDAQKPFIDDDKVLAIGWQNDMTAYLVGAIKELKAELDAANAKITGLEEQVLNLGTN